MACLVGMLQLLDEFHYKRLWEVLMGSSHERKPLKDFLMRVFVVFRDLVKQEVYPPDWLVIKMVANNVMLKSLQELAQPLAFRFLDSRLGYFDKEASLNIFHLLEENKTNKKDSLIILQKVQSTK